MTVESQPSTTSALFSEALKSMTWDDHENAEYTDYMQKVLKGEVSLEGYADMVAQHYFAYIVLEEAAEKMRNDPIGGKFVFPELNRLQPLEEDLEFLLGADWRDKVAPNEATKEYIERMREVCFDWAGGFVAHAYTRYLGDLSGGQVIKAAVERAHHLKDGNGVKFYIFDQIPDYKAFKIGYRDQLDGAPWSAEEQQRVIDEALIAYRLNTKVLAELGRDSGKYIAS